MRALLWGWLGEDRPPFPYSKDLVVLDLCNTLSVVASSSPVTGLGEALATTLPPTLVPPICLVPCG